MKKIIILIAILVTSTVFADDVYLKTVLKPVGPIVVTKPVVITGPTPISLTELNCKNEDKSNVTWNSTLKECVCNDPGEKYSETGCLRNPCINEDGSNYSCGNNAKCEPVLVRDKRIPTRTTPDTYHYNTSCICPENHIEFNLECIENPCLEYNCYRFGYCEAVEDQCECKEGYYEHMKLDENGQEVINENDLVCIGTDKVWDWRLGDRECDHNGEAIRYAVYSQNNSQENDNRCANSVGSCRCFDSPFNDDSSAVIKALEGSANDYRKENGWFLLHKDLGFPLVYLRGDTLNEKQRFQATPRFILYNKYTGQVKTFIFMRKFLETHSYGILKIYSVFEAGYQPTMLFNNTYDKVFTEGNYEYLENTSSRVISNGFSTNAIIPLTGGVEDKKTWFFSDFTASYDSQTKNIGLEYPSEFTVEIHGVNEANYEGEIIGTLTERIDVGSKANFNINNPLDNIAGLMKTFNNAKSYYSYGKEATTGVLKALNKLNDISGDGSTEIVWLSVIGLSVGSVTPYLAAGYALYDFFWGSSTPKTPSVFDAKLNIDMQSYTKKPLDSFLIRTPGSKIKVNSKYQPIYDKPLGVVTLLSPPVIEFEEYHTCYKENPYDPFECMGRIDYRNSCLGVEKYGQSIYNCPNDPIKMPGLEPKFNHYNYYKLAKLPKIEVNPDSGLELVSTNVAIIGEVDFLNQESYIEENWNKIRVAGNRGINYINKVSVEDIVDQKNGEITSKISKYSTPTLPYDVAEENLTMVFPKKSNISIRVTYVFKTKKSEPTEKEYVVSTTYVPDFKEIEDKATDSSKHYVGLFQKYHAPFSNVILRNLSNNNITETLKSGDKIVLSYDVRGSSLNTDPLTKFPRHPIFIMKKNSNDVSLDLPFFEGDNSTWEQDLEEISSFNLKKDLEERLENETCDESSNNYQCKLYLSLLDDATKDITYHNIKRKFIIPQNLSSGKYLLYVPVKYSTYRKSSINNYDETVRIYSYKKEIEIID